MAPAPAPVRGHGYLIYRKLSQERLASSGMGDESTTQRASEKV